MYKFNKDNAKGDSIPQRFSTEELLRIGLSSVDEVDADLIIGATIEDILPAIQKYNNRKQYLIWCDEPLWSNIFTKLDKPKYYFKDGQFYDYWVSNAAQIAVMNCFTGDVYFSNHHFLLDGYLLGANCPLEISKRNGFEPSSKGQGRKIAAIFGYRNAAKWFFESKLHGIKSLCNLRTTVALEGWIHGKVDIFGEGWPINGISKENTRWQEDRWKIKIDHLRNYDFSLCFENCVCPNYITEKIWHAIAAGTLPIYYGGEGNTIYRDFPPNSFIDFADFPDAASCWEFIESLSKDEYYRRLKICIDVLESAIRRSNSGQIPKELQISALKSRIKELFSSANSIPSSKFFGDIDWASLLGKRDPVILDVGANDGGTTAYFISRFPEANIYAFEPDPRALARFKLRLQGPLRSAKIQLYEGAVSDKIGEIEFHQSHGTNPNMDWHEGGWDLSGSINSPKELIKTMPTLTFDQKILVSTTPLDSWMQNKNIENIDLIWLDVQGAESKVINGAHETLNRTRYLHIEYCESELYEGQMNLDKTLELLDNFEPLQIYAGDILLKNKTL